MRRGKKEEPSKTRAVLGPGAKVVVWARVSSREQKEEGWSLPEQLREAREYAAAQGWIVAQEFGIDESATKSERETFLKMLETAEHDPSVAAILSLRLDRLQRNDPLDRHRLEALRRHTGLKIQFVKEVFEETAFGNFVYGLRQELAGLEVGLLKERIQEGFLGRAKEGWYPHPPLWPYVSGDRTKGEPPIKLDAERPQRAALARRLFQLVGDDGHTPEAARKILVEEGYVYGPSSRTVPRAKAYEMLRNRFFYGEFVFQGVIYPGKHEPLVSKDLWQRVQDVLDGRSRGPYGRGVLPFNGLVKCGICAADGRDAAMTCEAIKKKLKGGGVNVHVYLKCSMSGHGHGKKACPVKRIKVADLERGMGEIVELVAFRDDLLEKIRRKLRESHKDHVQRVEKALDSFRRQLTLAEDKKKRAFALALDGGIEASVLRETTAGLDAEATRARGEIKRLEGQSDAFYEEGIRVLELAQKAHRLWLTAKSAKKRRIVDVLVSNLVWDGVRLAPEWRKPFGLVAEGLSLVSNRGAGI